MSTNPQVVALVTALTGIQGDVNSLLDRVNSLQQAAQTAQQQAQQQASDAPVDLTEVMNLVSSIKSTLEGTANTVADHIDAANAPAAGDDATGGAGQPDGTSQEQTVIGDGGLPVTPTPTDSSSSGTGGSSGDDSSQQGVDTGQPE
jgi:hypothetical protein